MTNYTGMAKSNYVEVADKEALQDLMDSTIRSDKTNLSTYWHDGLFALGLDVGGVYITNPHNFLSELGECIDEVMVIRAIGHEGMRSIPDAFQWVVYPDGSWEVQTLDGPSELDSNEPDNEWEEPEIL